MSLLDHVAGGCPPCADRKSMGLPKIDMGRTRKRFQHHFEGTGQPIPGAAYTIAASDGRVFRGKTDQNGYTEVVELDDMQILSADFEEEQHG